jgi:SNF2 family DNA or RNA helicase
MVESQAVARVVRLGQKKPVSIIRYIIRGTVEQASDYV